MPTIDANGISIHYEVFAPDSGDAPPLLFFNGSFSTLATSRPLVQVFGSRLHTVAHDQRGLGETSIPPGPYTMADYAADGLALIDALGWETCRVVGISFGGMVAQEFAVTNPERVERLALLCTSPGGEGGSSYPMHELRALPIEERARVSISIMDTRFSEEWFAEHPSDLALVTAMGDRPSPAEGTEAARGEIEQANARRHHDVWDRLPAISCPTLVAAGRYDGIAALSNSEAIVSKVPDAQLRVYEGGHAFFAQDPRAFGEILDFLAE
ncbi:MAG: alpha/beta fold hydrolase [Actinobacteria bacterium]|nr:alpha/beta fold hydrolase [Actinomycetota bacterium]